MNEEPKHLSETIEDAVEGILRFVARLARTFWILLRHPVRPDRFLLSESGNRLLYTRPYTFLAIGGFFLRW